MGTAYTEFDCLGADLLSNLQTAILNSTDWSRPNSGSKPTLFKSTTTGGAQLAIDLNTTALAALTLSFTAYRTHDGTTAGAAKALALRLKAVTGTLATNDYHGVVSAGKDHLFIMIEGGRPGESQPDNATYGSQRHYLFMNEIVPYYSADTVPAVCVFGDLAAGGSTVTNSHYVFVSRNAADTADWVTSKLATLTIPSSNASQVSDVQGQLGLDSSKRFLAPYVVVENNAGLRGRLKNFYFAGWNHIVTFTSDVSLPPVGELVTIDGAVYKLVQVSKSESSNACFGAFGAVNNNSAASKDYSPVVAVPYS